MTNITRDDEMASKGWTKIGTGMWSRPTKTPEQTKAYLDQNPKVARAVKEFGLRFKLKVAKIVYDCAVADKALPAVIAKAEADLIAAQTEWDEAFGINT